MKNHIISSINNEWESVAVGDLKLDEAKHLASYNKDVATQPIVVPQISVSAREQRFGTKESNLVRQS